MPPDTKRPAIQLSLFRDPVAGGAGGWYVVEVRVEGKGVQATQGKTVRAALLNAADVISLMTEEA